MLISELLPTLKLRIVNVGFKKDRDYWKYSGVISPFSRLYLVTKGETTATHHGCEYRIKAGEMHLVPCFTLSDYECPEYFEYYYFHFTARLENGVDLFNLIKCPYQLGALSDSEAMCRRLYELLPGLEVTVCKPHDDGQKRDFLKKLEDRDDLSPGDFLESDGIFRQLLAPFLRDMDLQVQHQSVPLVKVLNYIEENISKPLSLPELASVMDLQPTYFSDLFHKVVGVRPIEFINRRKIEKAQVMLGGGASVKETAAALGFSDQAYLSRLFKKYTGFSPKKGLTQSSKL